ncbi:3'-nucleotidase / 5'-nucleotidase [Desulforamulus reducens MI-1]|uniref:5'-nucleotidase SurE n=1 Tax=Desulforamulus reducens (strain ATCC BAA-1160 / DSM 100696 / MI-1) TaxID=349161 RepID=SURE_DESRM|nr:5'/3'-nucleotidase SurE [Desulforamulus reducens]A4J5D2.1 RecName: Full=5'-nucleotidase SurE; AltName: Full=Nucleoside 5'-monophosphate phosphohydrolase [Desulforamulus reducens MI-1]ABO50285.1 3'-nucleotidase / 5'-nucleotidase [Desulforamulus reducens MI-1]
MRILISNDDGIYADGIGQLRKAMETIASEVYVVAPDRERSACGHGITVTRPLRAKVHPFKSGHAKGWVIDGTPADCVKLGLESLLENPPDLVVSGINLGPNLGTDVLYSGTVSAAYEAIINHVPAIAVSLAAWEELNYQVAADFMKDFIPMLKEHPMGEGMLLNINIPNNYNGRGIKVTRLGRRRYIKCFDKRVDPRGKTYFWMAGEPQNLDDDDPETDAAAVNDGYVSVTPLHLDLTDYSYKKKLAGWLPTK